ncbi:putative solute carrier family 22 member 31 [Bufo bufo]|uniref:putative solute carrier family 22 member 31 n=1 Tax=Bufo bufo TaxID=8384 RepID=UPI001ABDC8C2|nr:putative solute carrier family 22 member 31 [Bufo bufo]
MFCRRHLEYPVSWLHALLRPVLAPPSALSTLLSSSLASQTRMDFDGKVWPLAGGFGRYTRLVAVASWLPNVFVSLGFFSDVLYTGAPDYQCQGLTGGPCGGGNSSNNNSGATLSNSSSCPGEWGLQTQSWLESTLVTQWDLVCENGWKVPLEQICYLIGWLCGFIIFGCVCDRFGRRKAFISALMVALPHGVALCFCPGYFSFLGIRIVFGAALAGIFLSFYIARLELCPPGLRLMITMIGGFFWLGGKLLLPGMAVLCSDWKVLQGAVTGALLILSGYWCCHLLFPESPRWLLATQQLNRCKAELCLFSRANGIDTGDDFAGRDGLFTELDSLWEGFPRPQYYSVCSLFGTRLIWRNALILGFTTFIGSGIRPCFARNLMALGGSIPYFLQTGSEVLACIFLCITVNHWGRRAVLLLCTILTGFSSLLLLALTQYLFTAVSIAISVLGSLSSHAVVMLSVFYASEVLPTVIRGSGLGLILGLSILGQATLPIMNLQQRSGFFLHHVVLSSFCILSVLSLLLLPETKRKGLPDTLRQGDSLRRPPLLIHATQDAVPLLSHGKPRADYNPDSYAQLASATKKMIKRNSINGQDNEALIND